MKPETKKALSSELEIMKHRQEKNNYNIAWYVLIVAVISLIIFLVPLERFISGTSWSLLSSVVILICLLTILFQSLFAIIRITVDKRLRLVFEAVLEKESD